MALGDNLLSGVHGNRTGLSIKGANSIITAELISGKKCVFLAKGIIGLVVSDTNYSLVPNKILELPTQNLTLHVLLGYIIKRL